MQKFFFDVDDGVCPTCDSDGQEFPNRKTASQKATGLLAEIAKDHAMKGICKDITVDLKNASGRVVFTATLSVKAKWISWKGAPTRPDAPPRLHRHLNGQELPPAAIGNGKAEPEVQVTAEPFALDMLAAKEQGTISLPNLRQVAQ